MPKGPLMAFAYTRDEDHTEIFFARSEVGARVIIGGCVGECWDDVEVQRMPAFDKYGRETGQRATAAEYFEEGWRIGCDYCEHMVSEGDYCYRCDENLPEDSPDEDRAWPITDGDSVYCGEQCRDAHDAQITRIKAAKEVAKAALLAKWPVGGQLQWAGKR